MRGTILNWNYKKLRVVKLVNDSIQHLAASYEKIGNCVWKSGESTNKWLVGAKAILIEEISKFILTFNSIN